MIELNSVRQSKLGRHFIENHLDLAITMDLDGRLYVTEKGDNEQPAEVVQMITNLDVRLD